MGIGKSHTPEAFVKACEYFTYTEILSPKSIRRNKSIEKTSKENQSKKEERQEISKSEVQKVTKQIDITNLITKKPIEIELINKAFEMVYDPITGLANASQLGVSLRKIDPAFDIRNYGYTSFRKFLEALKPEFETESRDEKQGKTILVKRGK